LRLWLQRKPFPLWNGPIQKVGPSVGRFIIKERDGFEGFFFLTMSDRKYYRKALDQRERDKKEKQAFNKKDIVR
jgi:hypothetical protein